MPACSQPNSVKTCADLSTETAQYLVYATASKFWLKKACCPVLRASASILRLLWRRTFRRASNASGFTSKMRTGANVFSPARFRRAKCFACPSRTGKADSCFLKKKKPSCWRSCVTMIWWFCVTAAKTEPARRGNIRRIQTAASTTSLAYATAKARFLV